MNSIDSKKSLQVESIDSSCLINAAKEGIRYALTNSKSESDPRFGAAVLTSNGNIYSAGQYFSNTLSLTLHAEQAALAHAAAHGEYAIVTIACIGNQAAFQMSGGIIYPCHLCKQLLWESYLRSGINTNILIINENDQVIESVSLLNIMNYPWPALK